MSNFTVKAFYYTSSLVNAFSHLARNWTNLHGNLIFGTKNPGGYSTCMFELGVSYEESATIYNTFHHYFVEVCDGSGEVVWQGRIEDIGLEPGLVRITCYGLWGNAFDQYYNDGAFDPAPLAENGISYRDAWTPINATYERIAQSFTVSAADDAAMQDMQLRLSRTGDPDGIINFELRRGSEGGTLVGSNTMPANNVKTGDGFSEWLGIPTDAKVGADTYYLIAYGDSSYTGSVDGSNYIAVGRDTTGHYSGGVARYYDGSWHDLGGDLIFYIWPHPKWYHTDPVYTDEIIISIISECQFIDNTSDDFFFDTGIVSTPIKFSAQEKHGDAIAKLIGFGSSGGTPVPLFFGVYNDGIAHLRKFTDGLSWVIDTKELPQKSVTLASNLSGYRTRTAVLYSDEDNVRKITPWNINADLYDTFGYHRDGLYNLSGVTEAVAEAISDMITDIYTVPEQKITLQIEGFVASSSGKKIPSWRVRAGDIITLRNIFPSGATLSTEMEDRLDTLYVQETAYDASSGILSVTPTAETTALLDIILTLAGLSGGSVQ